MKKLLSFFEWVTVLLSVTYKHFTLHLNAMTNHFLQKTTFSGFDKSDTRNYYKLKVSYLAQKQSTFSKSFIMYVFYLYSNIMCGIIN